MDCIGVYVHEGVCCRKTGDRELCQEQGNPFQEGLVHMSAENKHYCIDGPAAIQIQEYTRGWDKHAVAVC